MKKNRKYRSILKSALQLFLDTDMNIYAGNATLFIITAMFPLIMLMVAAVNAFTGYNPSEVTDFVFQLLPDLSSFRTFFNSVISNIKAQSGTLLAGVSAVTALWSASSGVTAMQKGLNRLAGVQTDSIRDKLRALLFTLLLIIFFPVLTILHFFGSSIISLVSAVTSYLHIDGIALMVRTFIRQSGAVLFLLTFLILLLVYTWLPNYHRRWKDQLPGTVFVIVTGVLFTNAFTFFIPRFYHSSALYGSLASLFLVLLWLRVLMMMFFAGDALNIACMRYRQNPPVLKEKQSPEH